MRRKDLDTDGILAWAREATELRVEKERELAWMKKQLGARAEDLPREVRFLDLACGDRAILVTEGFSVRVYRALQ